MVFAGHAVLNGYVVPAGSFPLTHQSVPSLHSPMNVDPWLQVGSITFSHVCEPSSQNCVAVHCVLCVQPALHRCEVPSQ